jgi:hypothetical protein
MRVATVPQLIVQPMFAFNENLPDFGAKRMEHIIRAPSPMLLNSKIGLVRGTMTPKRPAAETLPIIDQIATAIAKADGGNLHSKPARYRRLALVALKPLAKPTGA